MIKEGMYLLAGSAVCRIAEVLLVEGYGSIHPKITKATIKAESGERLLQPRINSVYHLTDDRLCVKNKPLVRVQQHRDLTGAVVADTYDLVF